MSSLVVVDDNELDFLIVNHNLKKYSKFSTVTYYNGGLSFINYINEHAKERDFLPDTVFLDLNMPTFNGWDVLNALKTIYPILAKKINVYIVSSSINPIDVIKSKGYAFVKEFITKPFTKEHIFEFACKDWE
ncbi:response regulator [Mucilaginibacter sp.]